MKDLSWDTHREHYNTLRKFYKLNNHLMSGQFGDAILDARECMEYTMIEEGEKFEEGRNERNICY